MAKEVMIVVGAGQILLAIARRMGYGKQILLGDKSEGNAKAIGKVLEEAGFDVTTTVMEYGRCRDLDSHRFGHR